MIIMIIIMKKKKCKKGSHYQGKEQTDNSNKYTKQYWKSKTTIIKNILSNTDCRLKKITKPKWASNLSKFSLYIFQIDLMKSSRARGTKEAKEPKNRGQKIRSLFPYTSPNE